MSNRLERRTTYSPEATHGLAARNFQAQRYFMRARSSVGQPRNGNIVRIPNAPSVALQSK